MGGIGRLRLGRNWRRTAAERGTPVGEFASLGACGTWPCWGNRRKGRGGLIGGLGAFLRALNTGIEEGVKGDVNGD